MNFIQNYKFQKTAVMFFVIELSNWKKNALSTAQYFRREIIIPVPESIYD